MRILNKLIIGVLATVSISSCKKEFSEDLPLPTKLTPSLFAVNNNNMVVALDPVTGQKKWETRVDNNVTATPLVVSGALIVVDVAGRMYRINRVTGAIERNYPLGAAVTGSPLALDNDRLVVPVGNDIKAFNITNDFELLWQFGAGSPIKTSLAKNTVGTNPALNIFFVSEASVFAIKAIDGTLNWRSNATGGDKFSSSICAANSNYLYAGTESGQMFSFNSSNGSVYWQYPTGSKIESSPISVGGNIMFGSNDRTFYSVDSATGLLRWKSLTNDRILSSPIVLGQNVSFGSNDRQMYTINIIDGTLKWKNLAMGTITSSPLGDKGVLYYNSHDNNVYAVDAATGAQIWNYNTNGYMTSSMILDNLDYVVYPSISGNSPQ